MIAEQVVSPLAFEAELVTVHFLNRNYAVGIGINDQKISPRKRRKARNADCEEGVAT